MTSNEERLVRDMAASFRGIRNAATKHDVSLGDDTVCPRFTIEKWNEHCRNNDLDEHSVELGE